jgi:predicted nucleic acid-binding protein
MFRVLVDTSVWIDLAKDHREQPVIGALEALIEAREIALIVPQIVIDEFQRNRARVITETRRSLQSHFRLVREAVSRFGEPEFKRQHPESAVRGRP